ncbi:MAG: aromatic ring-hydroxylating dioxygenase subunit alpha [Actinomycetota bacterium]|nr:aromatic ring-hydroxylating dioxygenase subunit alpha [Actinomycetota bacterium]
MNGPDLHTPVREPVRRWGASVEQYPRGTHTVPASRYSDPAHFQRELDLVLRRHWLFGGVSTEVPEPGDFKVWEHMGETVVIIRKTDGTLNAFHNVCQHRGARIVPADGHCDRYFECKWHGWRYDEEGTVVRVPKREDFDPAALEGLRAMAVAVAEWRGLIFLNLAGPAEAPDFVEYLGEIADEFAPFGVEHMASFHHQSRPLTANWKAVLDGFNEAYHGATTHKVFNDNELWNLDQMSIATMGLHDGYFLPYRFLWDQMQATEDHHQYATCHYLVFPNTIFLFQPAIDTLNIMVAWPEEVGLTEFEFQLLSGPKADPGVVSTVADHFNLVLDEDAYAMVQSGATLRSLAYQRNLFGRREGRLTNLAENLERILGDDEPCA